MCKGCESVLGCEKVCGLFSPKESVIQNYVQGALALMYLEIYVQFHGTS